MSLKSVRSVQTALAALLCLALLAVFAPNSAQAAEPPPAQEQTETVTNAPAQQACTSSWRTQVTWTGRYIDVTVKGLVRVGTLSQTLCGKIYWTRGAFSQNIPCSRWWGNLPLAQPYGSNCTWVDQHIQVAP